MVSLCCGFTGCGGSSSPDAAPSSPTEPTDSSRAATLPLRTSDLPGGFAAVDVRSAIASPMVSECFPSLLLANATQVGEVFVRDDDHVSSQSYVLRSTEDAQLVLNALGEPAVQTCLTGLVQGRFDLARSAAALPTDLPSSFAAGSLDPGTAHYRVTGVQTTSNTTRTALTADLLISQSDRSISAVWLTWLNGSPEDQLERSLVTALRARAASALSS
jgi:hypothetical protein